MKHIHVTIQDSNSLKQEFELLSKRRSIGFDVETTGLDWWSKDSKIVGYGLGFIQDKETIRTIYIPVGLDKSWVSFDEKHTSDLLRPILSDESTAKFGANIKFDSHFARKYGTKISAAHDVQAMARLVRSGFHRVGLEELIKNEFQGSHGTWQELKTWGRENDIRITDGEVDPGAYAKVDPKVLGRYCGEDVYWTLRLAFRYLKDLRSDPRLWSLYKNVEQPLIRCTESMEHEGIRIDRGYLQSCRERLLPLEEKNEKRIYDLAGKRFNINSVKQITEILLPMGVVPQLRRRKRKDGSTIETPTVDKKCLDSYRNLPIIEAILEYKGIKKLLSTYVNPLLDQNSEIIHASIKPEAARTGRLSAVNPNLMNLPNVDESLPSYKRENSIRRAIIPRNNGFQDGVYHENVLLSVDMKQIEYRLLAHFSEDPALIEVFKKGQDFHAYVAGQLFDVPGDKLDKHQRSIGKKFNFAQLYGSSLAHLAEQCGITIKRAEGIDKQYRDRFPSIIQFKQRTECQCVKEGGVRNAFGRFRALPNSLSYRAVNTLIQGTAADLFKIAIIRVTESLQDKNSRLLFPVHDELVINWDLTDGDIVSPIIKAMTIFETKGVSLFRVPLDVDVAICRSNWEEQEDLDIEVITQAHFDRVSNEEEKMRKMSRDKTCPSWG
jgi:DNA polymerase-1